MKIMFIDMWRFTFEVSLVQFKSFMFLKFCGSSVGTVIYSFVRITKLPGPPQALLHFVVLVDIGPEWCGVQMQRLLFSLIQSETTILSVWASTVLESDIAVLRMISSSKTVMQDSSKLYSQ